MQSATSTSTCLGLLTCLQVVSAVIAGSQARQPISNPNRWIQLSFVFVLVFGCIVYFREEIWALGKGE
jgi:hypothetical protein